DGARDQSERLVSSARERVGDAESCRDQSSVRVVINGKVEAALENMGRAREISATEVGETESDHCEVQREGMIGRLSDPHGGLGVSDGFIEPAELGERLGEPGPRICRMDDGPPKALGPQLALECGVPLEEGDCVAELASDEVRDAKKGRCS